MQRNGFPLSRLGVAAAIGMVFLAGPAAAAPRVVASIAPLASVAAAVMEGVGKPRVILEAWQSPHSAMLKPSQARAIEGADLVLWVGPALEGGLDRILDARSEDWRRTHVLTAMALPNVALRPFRHLEEIGAPGHEAAAEGHDPHREAAAGEHQHHHAGGTDPHLWLDPDNAVAIADALAERLAVLDEGNAVRYRTNVRTFRNAVGALKADLAATLAPVKGKAYVVFHDAYQYFEIPLGMAASAALTLDPAHPVGGRHLLAVREAVARTHAVCVFAEPQAPRAAVKKLAGDLGMRSSILDPLGAKAAPEPKGYAVLLKRLAGNLADCLGGK